MPTGSEVTMTAPQDASDSDKRSENGGNGERRLSATSYDPTPYIQRARVTRPAPPKPSCNPMQFVQIKPCNLYQSAQEQLKRAEEVKKVKEVKKEDPEDWQCNLDNWKSSRRKRVEHIIDRVVEVKKLEMEEHDRTRRKSKTFSEMLEERGNRRKLSTLAVYTEDEANDFSDLGIGTSSASGKSSLSEDYDNHSVMSDNADTKEHSYDIDNTANIENGCNTRDYISSPGYDTSSSTAPASSPDPCEYTYEGAIQDYKTRVSRAQSKSNGFRSSLTGSYSKDSTPERGDTGSYYAPRRMSNSRIEDRLMNFEIKSSSDQSNDGLGVKKDLPKVDITKRRELFEKENTSSPEGVNGQKRYSGDFSNSKSIKERLSSLEKKTDDDNVNKKTNRMSGDITSIRDRLQHLEKQNSTAEKSPKIDVPVLPLKERLSSLQSAVKKEEMKKPVLLVDEHQLEILKKEEAAKRSSLVHQHLQEQNDNTDDDNLNSSQEILNIHDESNIDTDREDSGIHTTDVSCSVSQTDEQPELVNEENHHHINEDELCHQIQETEVDEPAVECVSIAKCNQTNDSVIYPDVIPVETTTNEAIDQEDDLKIVECSTPNLPTTPTTPAPIMPLSPEPPVELIDLETSVSLSLSESTSLSSQTVIFDGNNINDDHNSVVVDMTEEDLIKSSVATLSYNEIDQKSCSQCNLDNNITNNANAVLTQSPSLDVINVSKTNNEQSCKKIEKDDKRRHTIVEICEKCDVNSLPQPEIPTAFFDVNIEDIKKSHPFDEDEIVDSKSVVHDRSKSTSNSDVVFGKIEIIRTKVELKASDVVKLPGSPILAKSPIPPKSPKAPQSPKTPKSPKSPKILSSPKLFGSPKSPSSPTYNPSTHPESKPKNIFDFLKKNFTQCNSEPDDISINEVNEALELALQAIDEENNNEPINTKQEVNLNDIKHEIDVRQTTIETIENMVKEEHIYENVEKKPQSNQMIKLEESHKLQKSIIENNEYNKKLDEMIISPKTTLINNRVIMNNVGINDSVHHIDDEPYYQVPKSSEPYYEVPKNAKPIPVYENIEIFYPGTGNDTYPIGSGGIMEPPKEKPPPPPIDPDNTDDDEGGSIDHPYEVIMRNGSSSSGDVVQNGDQPMKRMNSTKRIKKELRNKRSSFLGIEGSIDDDSFLELTVAPPPDMAQLLQEERRLEKQLYMKAGLYDSSDTGDSRDSGVSENHSRQSSEPFTTSSEEHDDLLAKKEKEIIEVLEKEEEKRRNIENWSTNEDDAKIRCIEDQIREQEEVLRVERELLQLEQEELQRQRENLLLRENMARRELQHGAKMLMSANHCQSLQDINASSGHYANLPNQIYRIETDYRKSMSDLQEFGQKKQPSPPPVPPSKPLRSHIPMDNIQQHNNVGLVKIANGHVPPQQQSLQHSQSIDEFVPLRNYQPQSALLHGNMTRNTLLALSATPKPKFTDAWIQTKKSPEKALHHDTWLSYQQKRKSVPEGFNYNKHWLIQEAEQRRIDQQRGIRNNAINGQWTTPQNITHSAIQRNGSSDNKPLPDSVIQTLTQRVQSKGIGERKRINDPLNDAKLLSTSSSTTSLNTIQPKSTLPEGQQEKVLSVSGKKKCSHCGEELGRGAAMIIESLRLFYHIDCFKCCVCRVQLGDGLNGTDVRVRHQKLHCHNCYSSDDGIKFSCV